MAVRTDQMTTYLHDLHPRRARTGLAGPHRPGHDEALLAAPNGGPKTFRSDWKMGSTWNLEHKDVGLVVSGPEQVILESDVYRRLSYTWHSFTPRWAVEVGMDEATAETWRAEPRSKVTFDMEDVGRGVVKLTAADSETDPPVLAVEAQQRLRDRQADQLGTAQPDRVTRPAVFHQHVIDLDVQCGHEGVQISVHEGLRARRWGSNADPGHPRHVPDVATHP
ncbi:MAG: SRPBCC domain-containing protein [Streptosporangiaceae bacterium]